MLVNSKEVWQELGGKVQQFQKMISSKLNLHRALHSLAGKSLLSINDLSSKHLTELLDLAAHYKQEYKENNGRLKYNSLLTGENIGMIFQKRSTRTRISTEVGTGKLGGQALFLSSDDIQLGVNESIRDTANVLSRFNSILLARVNSHETVEELASHSDIPVINGLSEKHHPLQTLADFLTIREQFSSLSGLTVAWVGDGNNIVHDLMLASPKLGVNVRIATPSGYECDQDIIAETKRLASEYQTSVVLTNDPAVAVKGANVIATDTWVSMGQEEEYQRRVKDFDGFQVTMALCENTAARDWKFLHCLPRHAEEVSDEVFYSSKSKVFDEAENRMWTVMSVISALLGKSPIKK